MDACRRYRCEVIQYDCNTDCWLLDGCTEELLTTCGSSVYYRVTTTTTTTTTSSANINRQCFPDTASTNAYTCSARVYCSNQDTARKLGPMPLSACMDECKKSNCQAIQYDCNTDCWLLAGCTKELLTACGSSVYYRVTTTTTTIANLNGECFPDTPNAYTCSARVYCSNQDTARKLGPMPLSACMDECKRSNCQAIQYDCSTECWLLDDCGNEQPTLCGSSVYYPYLPGACFPNTADTGAYRCSSSVYCSNQAYALNEGAISLSSCMDRCSKHSNCKAIQYDCNTECWLLDHCASQLPSSCGSSVYHSTAVTTTTSANAKLGICFPNSANTGEFRCSASRYCSNQNSALRFGAMSLDACMQECKRQACQVIQYDCNRDCWLLMDSANCKELQTQCGSDLYYPVIAFTTVAPKPAEEEEDSGVPLAAPLGGVAGAVLLFAVLILWRWRAAKRRAAARTATADVQKLGRPRLESEEKADLHCLSKYGMSALPDHWVHKREMDMKRQLSDPEQHGVEPDGIEIEVSLAFDELVYVAHQELGKFQSLLSHTYRNIPTQDRPCPKKKCGKIRGGCPCVQPGGSPGLPVAFQVKRVIRVEDSDMWERYVQRRNAIQGKRSGGCGSIDPELFTTAATQHLPGLGDVLAKVDTSLNETYLWHGTHVRQGLAIAQDDFSLDHAGSGAGSMYGKGLYFAESSTKADEYAHDEPGGYYDGTRALLLCRVCIGKYHYVMDRDPNAIQAFLDGDADSTIGDRAAAVNTYREVVIYDADQVYPEYLVLYSRLHGSEEVQPPSALVPFQLQLPVYWVNVGHDPSKEPFRVHYHTRQKITQIVQRLATGSASTSRPVVKVVKRVEDSELWLRYVEFKRQLHLNMDKEGIEACTPPNELDGKPDSGHALTSKLLEEEHVEEAISTEMLDAGLNEMLLWHGTDPDAANAIAEKGFLVERSGKAKHGRRFGGGAYFAEDLDKSLSYAKKAKGGRQSVLLCRVVCGHMYYTEQNWQEHADKAARDAAKNSVLANPEGKGPREYIILDEAQVYPEYLIEIEVPQE
eukprot:TRINITY_DN5101_c0_g1_i1.p1 TRINITY_DN5101_c0_g1~~TRINITY_DN5101_c0_g1_i1.p1  ORF type:complete len:1132 (-),score=155.44 TRINITY_DN5101_c0_g1_i1:32-3166(-)